MRLTLLFAFLLLFLLFFFLSIKSNFSLDRLPMKNALLYVFLE